MLKRNIITESKSNFASPAFPIKKRDGSIRLVVDYRKLNQQMEKEVFPFPNIEDVLNDLEGAILFSCIDLHQGYFQISMASNYQHYTSFVLPLGQFEFIKMPFGLSNPPRTFQRPLEKT